MNNKTKKFIKNLSYTLTSNLFSIFVSTVFVFILPKVLTIEEYGYWQLFIFYSSFMPFLQFGWSDGLYLRYGGSDYKKLDKELFYSQFVMLLFSQIFITITIVFLSFFLVKDVDKNAIFYLLSVYLLLVNTRYFFVYVLQATNRFKEYSKVLLTDRIIYMFLISMLLIFGFTNYKLIIIGDLIGKVFSLLYAVYCCRSIVFQSIFKFKINFNEMIKSISAGFKLTLSNTASMLIVGVNRFAIERNWDVSTFGKVSLTLSISNFMMVFINAVGMILFPILRRTELSELPKIYIVMRTFLMTILLGFLIVYYPLKVVLATWLPAYSDSIIYMTLVFPMCLYEGKMALLVNTYLKTLRKEKLMLGINFVSLAISSLITYVVIFLVGNLDLAILSIVISLAIRSVIAETLLSRILKITVLKDLLLEISMTSIFIAVGWYLDFWNAIFIYLMAYGIYLIIKRKDIINTIVSLKILIKK